MMILHIYNVHIYNVRSDFPHEEKERRERKSRKRRNNARTYVLGYHVLVRILVPVEHGSWTTDNSTLKSKERNFGRRNTPENKDPLMFHYFIQTI